MERYIFVTEIGPKPNLDTMSKATDQIHFYRVIFNQSVSNCKFDEMSVCRKKDEEADLKANFEKLKVK